MNIAIRFEDFRRELGSLWSAIFDDHKHQILKEIFYAHCIVLSVGLGSFFCALQLRRISWVGTQRVIRPPLWALRYGTIVVTALSVYYIASEITLYQFLVPKNVTLKLITLSHVIFLWLSIRYLSKIIFSKELCSYGFAPFSYTVSILLDRYLSVFVSIQILGAILCSFILSFGNYALTAQFIERLSLLLTGIVFIHLFYRLHPFITHFLQNTLKESRSPYTHAVTRFIAKTWFSLIIGYTTLLLWMIILMPQEHFKNLALTSGLVLLVSALSYYVALKIPSVSKLMREKLGARIALPQGRLNFYQGLFTLSLFGGFIACMGYTLTSLFSVSLTWFIDAALLKQTLSKLLSVLFIAFIGLITLEILEMIISKIFKKLDRALAQKNLPSLMQLTLNITRCVVFGLTLLMVLSEFGLNITPILASAGVLGLAISLGSQTLFNDLIKGFFILTEGTMSMGDRVVVVISAVEHKGIVEHISLRNVQLRDDLGQLHIIPFSTIGPIVNESRPTPHQTHTTSIG